MAKQDAAEGGEMSSGNLLKEAHLNEDVKESAPAESQPFSLPEDEQRP